VKVSRRAFLAGGLALSSCGQPRRSAPASPVIDLHVHLVGIGDGGSGCYLSPTQTRHVNFAFLRRLLGIHGAEDLDRAYLERLAAEVRTSSVDRVVLLAQDGRYDAQGRLDLQRTHFYVPNDYLFAAVAEHPTLFVPCASINPKRPDALDELDRCAELGARLVKVHPPTQDVDPADPSFRPFYRRLAELRVLLMVHTGTEHSSPVVGFEYCDPARLELALGEGTTVVAAHSGFGSFLDGRSFFPSMIEMVRRHPRLYCDTSVLASLFRWRCLPELLEAEEVLARVVHASDWPFPANPLVFWNRLAPARLASLVEERNLLERDLRLKWALGLPEACFTRGARLLGLS
jgi:hypothetical protein